MLALPTRSLAAAIPGRNNPDLPGPIAACHEQLRRERRPLGLRACPPHLSEAAARTAAYGDAWTCRTSSELLQGALRARGIPTQVDHVLPEFFAWPGEPRRVAFHYFLVDHPPRPGILIDPTVFANGLGQPATQVAFRRLATRLAQRMNLGAAAQRLGDAIAQQAPSGLLVLRDAQLIDLFRGTLCALALGGNPSLPIRLR